jgi:hypothetical protein
VRVEEGDEWRARGWRGKEATHHDSGDMRIGLDWIGLTERCSLECGESD